VAEDQGSSRYSGRFFLQKREKIWQKPQGGIERSSKEGRKCIAAGSGSRGQGRRVLKNRLVMTLGGGKRRNCAYARCARESWFTREKE